MLDNLCPEYNIYNKPYFDDCFIFNHTHQGNYILKLIQLAKSMEATDIHIVTDGKIYFRINGFMIVQEAQHSISLDKLREDLNELIPEGFDSSFYDKDKEVDFSLAVKINNEYIYLRGNIFKIASNSADCFSLAMRLLPSKIPTIEELNLPRVIKGFVNHKYGLVLISGATGHGKTTTLASLIELINNEYNYNIITIEDPIEYRFSSNKSCILQRQVGIDTENFNSGLRAALREDPDVIVLGELRDAETIRTALWAAESGHLVLATIHAGNATETVDKIVQYFPHEQEVIRYSLANSLRGIISQRLYPSKNQRKHRICVCDVLLATNAVKMHIKNNDFPGLRMDMQLSQGMILMSDMLQEYKDRNLI